jgi:DNA-binding NarL/FixJ family response regulator
MTSTIRLLLADDHYVVLMGLVSLLKLEKGLRVVKTAENGAEAVDLYREHRPDVALLDVRMPGMDGVNAAAAIRAEFPDARVLMLTSFDTEEDIHRALQAGVAGYILKDSKRPELVAAIRAVHAGGHWIPGEVAQRAAARAAQPDLSSRQRQVLELVAKGLSNKEIAQILGFSEDGTKQHLRQIYARLGVADRAEAAAEAIRRGILRPD